MLGCWAATILCLFQPRGVFAAAAASDTTSSGGCSWCWADREFWEAFEVPLRMVTCAQGPINRESKDGGEDHSEIQLALSPSSPLPSLSP